LAKNLTDPTQLNFAKFQPWPTPPHLTTFSWGRLSRNRPNFCWGSTRPNFNLADSTKFCHISAEFWITPRGEFWSRLTQRNQQTHNQINTSGFININVYIST